MTLSANKQKVLHKVCSEALLRFRASRPALSIVENHNEKEKSCANIRRTNECTCSIATSVFRENFRHLRKERRAWAGAAANVFSGLPKSLQHHSSRRWQRHRGRGATDLSVRNISLVAGGRVAMSFRRQEGSFINGRGERLHTLSYVPEHTVKALLIFHHG